jgi:hypothetical protein
MPAKNKTCGGGKAPHPKNPLAAVSKSWRDLRLVDPKQLTREEYHAVCMTAMNQYRESLLHWKKIPSEADIAAGKEFSKEFASRRPSSIIPEDVGFDENDTYDLDLGYFGYDGTGGHPLLYVQADALSVEQYFEICKTAVTDDSERNKSSCHFTGHALELVNDAVFSGPQYFKICVAAVRAYRDAFDYIKQEKLDS